MGLPPPAPQRDNQTTIWRHLYAGTTLAVTILVCVFIGVGVDKRWGLRPWGTLIGAFAGIAIGLYNFLQEFLHDEKPPTEGS